ncbi:kinase-like protein [Aspergillus ellipticus CBS 707.79]|uniref:non-specific serine/threonine protein kinase n=1 Tax=Aspergillus ellipticus CBS 707.79 TaxID=1448320 RepID=A0A319CVH7_9EURO|nr:kinase-like protein [Aspergillus ellipticus CBS 707.79]
MPPLLKWALSTLRRRPIPCPPLCFPVTGYDTVPANDILEEERFPAFRKGEYYPVHIGDVFHKKYQVVGKLGFGGSSTVWFARDLIQNKHATLKIYTHEESSTEEIQIYAHLQQTQNRSHPGYPHVRGRRSLFPAMWDSFRDLLYRNQTGQFSEEVLRFGLMQVFLALDYLHTECRVHIHTDIKSDNILLAVEDDSVLDSFVKEEMEITSARKLVDGVLPVYASRRFGMPAGARFGRAVLGDESQTHDEQQQQTAGQSENQMIDLTRTMDISA